MLRVAAICVLFLLTFGAASVGAQIQCEVAEADCAAAEVLLAELAISEQVNVFYWGAAEDAAGCLGGVVGLPNLVQICQLRSLFGTCGEQSTASLFVLNDCRGRRCRGFETEDITLCVLDLVGIQFSPDESADGFTCGIPPSQAFLLKWGDPPWAQGLNEQGRSHCLTNMPEESAFQRRMGCRDGRPRVQYRVWFPDRSFLQDRQRATCLIEQICDGEAIYTSRALCYERLN